METKNGEPNTKNKYIGAASKYTSNMQIYTQQYIFTYLNICIYLYAIVWLGKAGRIVDVQNLINYFIKSVFY